MTLLTELLLNSYFVLFWIISDIKIHNNELYLKKNKGSISKYAGNSFTQAKVQSRTLQIHLYSSSSCNWKVILKTSNKTEGHVFYNVSPLFS